MKTNETKQKHQAGAGGLLSIAARLKEQVMKADAGSSWREAMRGALASVDRDHGWVQAAQVARGAGAMDADEAAFFIFRAVEGLAEHRYDTDAELIRINQSIAAVEKAHGLKEDEYWPRGEAPDDIEKLYDAWERRSHEIKAAVLREYGENTLADLLLADPSAFSDRIERGRYRMFGPLPEELDEEVEGLRGLDK